MKVGIDVLSGNRRSLFSPTGHLRKLYRILVKYDVVKYCVKIEKSISPKPWQCSRLDVCISRLDFKKNEYNLLELKQYFLNKINSLPKCKTVHMYCDGSVVGNKVGCGVVIREFFEDDVYTDDFISKRVEDNSSSTAAELHAILEGLKVAALKLKNLFVFVDSQSALFALNSKLPTNNDLVMNCKMIVCQLKEKGISVQFFWIPSHIGISLNEVADDLAKKATDRLFVDTESQMSLNRIKKGIKQIRNLWDSELAIRILEEGSASMDHYLFVCENTHITYGKTKSKIDTLNMRLRLGYNYCWQYIDDNGLPCKLCGEAFSHTLEHYLLECFELLEFRDVNITSVKELVCFMLNNHVTEKIVQKFPTFYWNM